MEQPDAGAFVTSELVEQRTRRAADLYSEAQDERQYLEIITRFVRSPRSSSVIFARNRLVQYLTLPGLRADERDKRAALAAGRAISFFDYDWTMERVSAAPLGTPLRA